MIEATTTGSLTSLEQDEGVERSRSCGDPFKLGGKIMLTWAESSMRT